MNGGNKNKGTHAHEQQNTLHIYLYIILCVLTCLRFVDLLLYTPLAPVLGTMSLWLRPVRPSLVGVCEQVGAIARSRPYKPA